MYILRTNFNRTTYALLLIYFLLGNAFVILVPIFVDEGFYVRAANNILSGQLLYVDFVYNHPPLMPYLYSVLSGFGFASYVLLRYVSFLLTLGAIILVYLHVLKVTQNKSAANFSIFLIVVNGVFLYWSSIIKMFPLDNIFFYGAFFSASLISTGVNRNIPHAIPRWTSEDLRSAPPSKRGTIILCFLSGFLAGAACNTRLSFLLPTTVLFAGLVLGFYKSGNSFKKSLPCLLAFAGGLLIPSLLTIYFLYNYPDYFLYGLFKHNLDAETTKWNQYGSNWILWVKFFFPPQNILLLILLLVCLKFKFEQKILSYATILALILMNVPGYGVNQYNVVIIPFAAYVIGVNYVQLKELAAKYKYLIPGFMLVYTICMFVGIPNFRHFLMGTKLDPNLIELKEIVDYEKTLPGRFILASWDAYSVFSDKKKLLKNELVYSSTDQLSSPEEIQKFSLPDSAVVSKLISDKVFDVIILHDASPFGLLKHVEGIRANYLLNKSFGKIEFYLPARDH
jgi:hypothetical protein